MGQYTCEGCGKTFFRQRNDHQYKYCCQACYYDARFGKVIQDEIPAARNALCLEALKLCQSGLSRRAAARQIGIQPSVLNEWFYKYGAENEAILFADRVCAWCGKSLLGMKNLSGRKYCSRSCANKTRYLQAHPEIVRARSDQVLRTRALELYWGGLEGRTIAKTLEISEGTVYSWIHDFGRQQERRRDPEVIALLPINLRIEGAEDAQEWALLLQKYSAPGPKTPVCLVGGTVHGTGEVSHLAAIVCDALKCDPCDGRIYAFCSLCGRQISTIQYKNNTWCCTKLPKIKGQYIWPSASVAPYIEVSQNEFEFLLTLQKTRGPKPYFT